MICGGFSGSRSRNVLLEVCEMCEQWRLHFSFVDLDTRCRCHTSRAHNRILADRRMGVARIMYALFFTTTPRAATTPSVSPRRCSTYVLRGSGGRGRGKIRATHQYLVLLSITIKYSKKILLKGSGKYSEKTSTTKTVGADGSRRKNEASMCSSNHFLKGPVLVAVLLE